MSNNDKFAPTNHYDPEFEARVRSFVRFYFNNNFSEKLLPVGDNKDHKFNLVSENNNMVIECLELGWTEDGKLSSEKIGSLIETIFYLSRIKVDKKVLVLKEDINDKDESLIEAIIEEYDGILDDIEVWDYSLGDYLGSDQFTIKRSAKNNWYKELY